MMKFDLLNRLITELNVSNSTLDKTSTLKKPEYNDDFVKGVLRATHNPFKLYNVTPKNLKKRSDLVASEQKYTELFDLLNALSLRSITGHAAIGEVNAFIHANSEYADIIYNIFDRNLKTRVSEKIINKVFKDLIPTFDVALANKFDEKQAAKIDFTKDIWYASRKLDGLRCIVIIDETGDIKIYSRSGKEFTTLDVVKEELQPFEFRSVVLDGEICIVDFDGNEDFQAILKLYKKKDFTIPNPRFKIFDMIPLEDFQTKKGVPTHFVRQQHLNNEFKDYDGSVLSVVEQCRIISGEHLIELNNEAQEEGWEGIMIRKDIPYEGKRSNNLLKCKKFHDAEYIVKYLDVGPFRVIVDGVEVTETMLRNVVIEHKGYEVGVGSGFTIEQRRYYCNNPDEILGKEITVQYFEETSNQEGGISLRFPTIKAIYKDGRTV